jgi:type IV pilus assembly protein PilA
MSGHKHCGKVPSRQAGLTIIELMIVIAIISIIMIIAIPVYQQYTARARVTEGLSLAAPIKNKIAEHYQTNSEWPDSNSNAGVPPASEYETEYVETIEISQSAQDGTITITYKTSGIPEVTAATNTLIMTPTADPTSYTITWECDGGTLPAWARPARCR